MVKLKVALFLWTIWGVGKVVGQTNPQLKEHKLVFTTSVLEYFPFNLHNSVNINLGTEIYTGNFTSVNVNLGLVESYKFRFLGQTLYPTETIGARIQVEGRKYLNRHKLVEPFILLFWPHIFQYNTQELLNTGYYIALGVSNKYTITDKVEYLYDFISMKSSENLYQINRIVTGIDIRIGYQCIKRSNFTIDYAVGIGGRYVLSRTVDKFRPDKEKYIKPLFVYKIKLGWAFKVR